MPWGPLPTASHCLLGTPTHPPGMTLETGRHVGYPLSPKRAPLGCPAPLWDTESRQPPQSFVPRVACAVSNPPGLTHTRRGGGSCRNGWKYLIIHVGHRDYSCSGNICTTGRRLAGLGHPRRRPGGSGDGGSFGGGRYKRGMQFGGGSGAGESGCFLSVNTWNLLWRVCC